MSEIIIYITFKDAVEAKAIAAILVEKRLVACANILAPHDSLYWWECKVETAQEIAVIFKTSANLFEKVEAAIQDMHSYEVPCIVSWPIEKGHAAFLEWISQETAA